MLGPILAAVIPVLTTAGLGFIWVRAGRPLENGMLTPLVVDIGTPCLIFATFAKTAIAPGDFATIALATIAACCSVSGFLHAQSHAQTLTPRVRGALKNACSSFSTSSGSTGLVM